MSKGFVTRTVEETERAGQVLASVLRAGDVVALTGDLGAGKTHLVQGVAAGLGVEEPVASPTFNLLMVHPGRLPLYHFDLYRLESAADLDDIGFAEVVDSDGVSMIEWGDRFPEELPADHLLVAIRVESDGTRRFDVRAGGPRSAHLAEEWLAAVGEAVHR